MQEGRDCHRLLPPCSLVPVDEGASATGQPRLTKSLVEEFNIMPGTEKAEESNIFGDLVLISSSFFVCWVHWAFWYGYTEESKLARVYPQLPASRHELGDLPTALTAKCPHPKRTLRPMG